MIILTAHGSHDSKPYLLFLADVPDDGSAKTAMGIGNGAASYVRDSCACPVARWTSVCRN